MIKAYAVFAVFLLAVSFVSAVEGDVFVHSLKVYEDGLRVSGDFDDDEFDIEAGKNVEIQVRVENPYNASVDVTLEGTLFDVGNDIVRIKTVTVGKGERSSAVVFEYFIPADTRQGSYEWLFEYGYSFGGDSFDHEKEFSIQVFKEETSVTDLLVNLTREIRDARLENNGLKDENLDLLGSLVNLTGTVERLASCEGSLVSTKNELKSREEYKNKYEAELNKTLGLQARASSCAGEKTAMFTLSQVEERERKAASEAASQQDKEKDQLIIFGGIIASLWIYFNKKKQKVGGGGAGEPITGTWK